MGTRLILGAGLACFALAGCMAEAPETPAKAKPVTEAGDATLALTTVPDWARANIRYMSAGTGQWIADNATYRSEGEPWDSYVIEWTAGPDDLSMTARMYALKDGQPSQGDFWSFYQFWDYPTGQMRIIQNGWGVHGEGTIWMDEDGATLIAEQRFTPVSGPAYSVRHETAELSETEHRSASLNPSDAGTWVTDRAYVWVRTSSDAVAAP